MSPKTLQMILGHASIEFTLDVYTHLEVGDVLKSFFQFVDRNRDEIYRYNRIPDIVTPDVNFGEEEGVADMAETPDDDE